MPRLNAAAIAPLLSWFLLAGCGSSPTGPRQSQSPPTFDYKAGTIIVGFYPDVTEEQAGAMFAAQGLTWVSQFPKTFSYWVEVVSGDPEADAAWLSESPIVISAETGSPNGGPVANYIYVTFKGTATPESAQALIDSRPGLVVSSTHVAPKTAIASVQPGQEQHWIEVLTKDSIVRYATLDYIGIPAGS
jgi:hypothetical protein